MTLGLRATPTRGDPMCFRPEHERKESTEQARSLRGVDGGAHPVRRRPPRTAPRGNGELERSDVNRAVEKLYTLVGR